MTTGRTGIRPLFPSLAALSAAVAFVVWSALATAQEPLPVEFHDTPLTVATAGGDRVFRVEVVADPDKRARGLMYRKQMAEDAGMLFDFGSSRMVSMWMRNTWLPLDMLFIDANGSIRTIRRDTEPFSEETISSGEPVRFVLEINSGMADALGIAVGDTVDHPVVAAAAPWEVPDGDGPDAESDGEDGGRN